MPRRFARFGGPRGTGTPTGPTTTPSYAFAGNGTDGTGTLNVPYAENPGLGHVEAGHCLLLHIFVRNDTGEDPTVSGWTLLSGPDSSASPTSRQWVYGLIAAGTETGTKSVTFAAGSHRKSARMYAIRNVVDLSVEDVSVTNGNTDPINMPSVTAGAAHRLAVAFIGADDDNAVGSSTGESGGDWTEAVAEYLGSTGTTMQQLQTAALDSGGAISGGSTSMGADDDWICSAFALVGT